MAGRRSRDEIHQSCLFYTNRIGVDGFLGLKDDLPVWRKQYLQNGRLNDGRPAVFFLGKAGSACQTMSFPRHLCRENFKHGVGRLKNEN